MNHHRRIAFIGLGFVGLTTAVALGKLDKVVAFDTNGERIEELKKGIDRNEEVTQDDLLSAKVDFTDIPSDLSHADFYIISVPTPLDDDNSPDLNPLLKATETVAKVLKKGDIIVYESTVYPGVTEEICIPHLETTSHLVCGKDFSVAYSPERINPADKEHVFKNITKIVAATDSKTLNIVADVYGSVIQAEIYSVSSIKVAEACKVIENTQRDVNIALMNEMALLLHKLDIDTGEVIAAMQTKWNSLPFYPGLVGGHCIGVNSYYLMHKATELGFPMEIVAAARRVNESIAHNIITHMKKTLKNKDISIEGARVGVFGITYKENCSDVRDSRVIDMINELQNMKMDVYVNDPVAEDTDVKNRYGIELTALANINNMDAVIFSVAHQAYVDLTDEELKKMLKKPGLIIDIKNIFQNRNLTKNDINIWRL